MGIISLAKVAIEQDQINASHGIDIVLCSSISLPISNPLTFLSSMHRPIFCLSHERGGRHSVPNDEHLVQGPSEVGSPLSNL